jgi:hypothetical protein
MTDWPDWRVSSLTPIMVVEVCGPDEVRDVAFFRIPDNGLLRSAEGERAVKRARLGAAAPALAKALEAALLALRSYQQGNGSPELAEEIVEFGDRVIATALGLIPEQTSGQAISAERSKADEMCLDVKCGWTGLWTHLVRERCPICGGEAQPMMRVLGEGDADV